ncbi:ribosome biogenesis/translation initiation ATPase RLI [[Eubacterium] cellulosolvens]
MVRVAVLDRDRCRPKDCGLPCVKYCPQVRNRVEAIKLNAGDDVVNISEALCSGCGICTKKCPFKAIDIVNLPEELEAECSHRFGRNRFKLYRLPIPKEGFITGLVGRNGIGKTTALKILSGELKPNLGLYSEGPSWDQIIQFHKGSPLQNYFRKIYEKEIKVIIKPQYIDRIPQYLDRQVIEILNRIDERNILKELKTQLDLNKILDRKMSVLSGGELQRVAVAAAACRQADVYIFDEPSSHLDVYQRIKVARVIRDLLKEDKMVLLAEHDLAMLDYLSDQVCLFYGKPGVYGIVSHVHGVRVGINIYMDGFIPDENMRFRSEPIRFPSQSPRVDLKVGKELAWDYMTQIYEDFTLKVEPGSITSGEIVGILGPNGIGKTTFIKMLAGLEEPKEGLSPSAGLTVSYKPQYISTQYEGDVQDLLRSVAGAKFDEEIYQAEILLSMGIADLLERDIKELSGGELQRVAIATCFSKEADIYLLDEPSAYLDIEERLAMARIIRNSVDQQKSFIFIVEHDLISLDFTADSLMIFSGDPGIRGFAVAPTSLRKGMNSFLSAMKITFRRDMATGRPRVNKPGSKNDKMQKDQGEYYYIFKK